MKIWTDGARFYADQISRIDAGFVELGHELTPYTDEADLIYINNPPFKQAILDRDGGTRARLVFDVQDIPHHIKDFDLAGLVSQLKRADAVTSISRTTAADLKRLAAIDSTVVYQPIMPVTRTRIKTQPYRVMLIGRVNDENKGSELAVSALLTLGFSPQEVVTVGSDIPWYGGAYAGVVSPARLNDLYNSVDFVVCCGHYEGICLPLIEAMAAGAIPLMFNDLSTRAEFMLDSFPEYDQVDRRAQSLVRFVARFMQDNDEMTTFKDRLHQHYLTHWAHHFTGRAVAEKILAA